MHCTGSNVALPQSNQKEFQSFRISPLYISDCAFIDSEASCDSKSAYAQ
jgi:hypothetical protein